MKDALLKQTIALPAAGAVSYSSPIQIDGGSVGMVVSVSVDALTAIVDEKSVTVNIQESDSENSGYENISELSAIVSVGDTGAPAQTVEVCLPPNPKKYIRLKCAVESGGGDNTAKNATLEIKA